ncbi:MAG: DNA polymerase III subunit beta [Pseudomonadota bacterium]|nr:DNA polymerase III subunit beta [Pseudomonadota bacterium]
MPMYERLKNIRKGEAMQIAKAKLDKILAVLGEAVPRRTALPIVRNVWLGQGIAAATNLERQIVVSAPELDGDPIIPPHTLLSQVVGGFPEGQLVMTLDRDTGRVNLNIGAQQASVYSAAKAQEFPPLALAKLQHRVELDGDFFVRHLAEVAVNAATGESRPVLNGVLLQLGENTALVASDGFRLAVMHLGRAMPELEPVQPGAEAGSAPGPVEPEAEPTVLTCEYCGRDLNYEGECDSDECPGNTPVGTCRVCGCTEDNACVVEGRPDTDDDIMTLCSWVEPTLCSSCEEKAADPPTEPPAAAPPPPNNTDLIIPIGTVWALCKLWKMLDLDAQDSGRLMQSRRLSIEYGRGGVRFNIPAHWRGQPMPVTLTSQVIQGRFPNYQTLIPASQGQSVVFQAQDLMAKVKFLAPLAYEGSGIIRLVWGNDSLMVSARAEEAGAAGADVRAMTRGAGNIAFNVRYLEAYLKDRTGTVLLDYHSPSSPGVFSHEGHALVVLMPMFVQSDSPDDGKPSIEPKPAPVGEEVEAAG